MEIMDMVHPTPTWLKQYEIKKGQQLSPKTQFKKGQLPFCTGQRKRIKVKCYMCDKEKDIYPCQQNKNNRYFCSSKCQYAWMKTFDNPLYKGGFKNSESYKFRIENRHKYEQWRYKVLVKADFICAICNKPDSMEAHHIKSFKNHPELRFDVANGQCMCKGCHNKTKGKALKIMEDE